MSEGKVCTKCSTHKPLQEFFPSKKGYLRRSSDCRSCRSAYYRHRYATIPDYREAVEASRLRNRYGVTAEWLEATRVAQNNRCPICSREFSATLRLNIDHDHKTGAVRALLCNPCNTALGSMQDDPAVLRSAASYLEVYRSPQENTIDPRAEGHPAPAPHRLSGVV